MGVASENLCRIQPSSRIDRRVSNAHKQTEAEFKEFEPRLKYGWFHLKLYSIFQDLSGQLIKTGFWQF